METPVAAASGPPVGVGSGPAGPAPSPRRWTRRSVAGLAASLLALAAGVWWAWPRAAEWLTAVSTVDAYVDSHVTLVAPRIAGQVVRVLVDDNDRVHKGDLLVERDRGPFQAQVNLKQAEVEAAEADLRAAESQVRGDLALARGQRWKLQMAIEGVGNQVAVLRSRVAAPGSREATLSLARVELARVERLIQREAVSRQEFDQADARFRVAEADAREAAERVGEAWAALGLPPSPPRAGARPTSRPT